MGPGDRGATADPGRCLCHSRPSRTRAQRGSACGQHGAALRASSGPDGGEARWIDDTGGRSVRTIPAHPLLGHMVPAMSRRTAHALRDGAEQSPPTHRRSGQHRSRLASGSSVPRGKGATAGRARSGECGRQGVRSHEPARLLPRRPRWQNPRTLLRSAALDLAGDRQNSGSAHSRTMRVARALNQHRFRGLSNGGALRNSTRAEQGSTRGAAPCSTVEFIRGSSLVSCQWPRTQSTSLRWTPVEQSHSGNNLVRLHS
jgi:hypothetical protein